MSDNMCEHGGLDGNCLRCKDSTITTLEAEKAQKQLVIDDCKRNLKEQDATIAALREEVAEVKKRYQLSVYAEETERKARVDMTSDNAALRTRCEAAEGKVERVRKTINDPMVCEYQQMRNWLIEDLK